MWGTQPAVWVAQPKACPFIKKIAVQIYIFVVVKKLPVET